MDTDTPLALIKKDALISLLGGFSFFSNYPARVSMVSIVNSASIISIRRRFSLIRANIRIHMGNGAELGYFKQNVFSTNRTFMVHNREGRELGTVVYSRKNSTYTFSNGAGDKIGTIEQKGGFLSGQSEYVVRLHHEAPQEALPILMAAAMAVDLTYGR